VIEDMSQSLVPPVGVIEDMSQSLVPPVGVIEDMSQSLVPPLGVIEDMTHALVPPVGVIEDMSHTLIPPIPPAVSGGKRKELYNPALTIRAIICEISRDFENKGSAKDKRLNEFYLTAAGGSKEIKQFIKARRVLFNGELFSGSDAKKNSGDLSLINRIRADPTTSNMTEDDISKITSDSKDVLHDIFIRWMKYAGIPIDPSVKVQKEPSPSVRARSELRIKQLKCFIATLFKAYVTGYDFNIDPHRFPGYVDGSTEIEKYTVITNVVYKEFRELIDDLDTSRVHDGTRRNLFNRLGLDESNNTGSELINYVLHDYDPSVSTSKYVADCKLFNMSLGAKGGTRKLLKNLKNKTRKNKK
jgi:hypothetical protein